MAAGKEAVSFDEIIQADRQRRKNEALANEIFGKNRKTTPSNGSRKPGTGPSLASRVGVTKRSFSNTPRPKADVDLRRTNNTRVAPRITRPPRDNPIARLAKNDLLYDAAVVKSPRNGLSSTAAPEDMDKEISIRGTAGPYIVIGSNFAPGTTAADIESAMIPSTGEMQGCRILTSYPTVIAEMIFAEKRNADSVISTFNNKKADGRILHVYLKTGGPARSLSAAPVRQTPIEPRASRMHPTGEEPSYNIQREQSDRNRRRADPEFQDGSYGFDAKEDQIDVDMDAPREAPRDVPRDTPRDIPRDIARDIPRDIPRDEPRDDRRDGRRNERRDIRYNAPKDVTRDRLYFDRDRDGGRARNNQRLYSDDLYPRFRGRGFR